MWPIYIAVPTTYPYRFDRRANYAEDALSREFNLPVHFVTNEGIKFGHPATDVYRVELPSEQDQSFFLLKYNFVLLDNKLVDDYIQYEFNENAKFQLVHSL